ncbi:MAG: hypothetical protein R3D83_09340 [Caenibius sp.]
MQSRRSFNSISDRVHFVRHDALAGSAYRNARRPPVVDGIDDHGDVVECLRHWIVHLEQTHASPNTIRAYVRHVVDFANFLGANGAGIS